MRGFSVLVENLSNPGESRSSQDLPDRFYNDYDDYCQFGKDKLIVGSFRVVLEQEVGFVDYSVGRLTILRLGHQQLF